MQLNDLSTRELIERLAELEDQVRMTASHLPDGQGGAMLNPRLEELALEELDVRQVLRQRRQREANPGLRRLLAGRSL